MDKQKDYLNYYKLNKLNRLVLTNFKKKEGLRNEEK